MIEVFELIADKAGIVMGVALGSILVIAIIRMLLRSTRGESISVSPVGVMNDLSSSITGINKHSDMAERGNERAGKKTE